MFQFVDIIFLIERDNSINFIQFLPLLTGIFGVLLGYWLREITEDYQDEFYALQVTAELLNNTPVNDPTNIRNIGEFYNKIRLNLRVRRLIAFNSIITTLESVLNGDDLTRDDFVEEKAKIDSRLKNLKKRGYTARSTLIIKDLFSR